MKLNNPFLVRGYFGPEYFCDRQKETKLLVDSVVNEGDVTLIAPRRYGKTGLIHNAFRVLPPEYARVYLDIYSTRCLVDFSREFAAAVIGALETKLEKTAHTLVKFFRSCRPTIVPTEDGLPKFSFDVVPSAAEATLKETFDYLAKKKRRVVIAIDEFQQVLDYPEKGTEALLRSLMQKLPWVRFVFAGSRQHLMREMFLSPRHPFYQSTDMLSLKPINREAYCSFAERFFAVKRKPFSANAFSSIYDRFDGVTWYVQMVLNRHYEDHWPVITPEIISQTIQIITQENEATYQTFMRLITPFQGRLLRAIACEGSVKEVLGKNFLMKYQLGASSTVRSAIKTLVGKELVLDQNNTYEVYDRFFGIWLKNGKG